MSKNYYQLYLDQTLQLASSIVIKSTETADALNTELTNLYGTSEVDPLNPKSWRYYMNLAGEYHPRDQVMQVVSLDTLETIVFNKENLTTHTATAKAYAYGSRYFKELVAQFPTQYILIMGILYPADKTTAINGDDGLILSYPPGMIEENEYTLVDTIQTFIYRYKLRWTNKQFSITHELYPAFSLGIMYLFLAPEIWNARLRKCKTNEAHSFHRRQYLTSRGFPDDAIDLLTLDQSLYFYMNIDYLRRNAGKTETFNTLLAEVLTNRNIPLADYTMQHDVSKMPTKLYPEVVFKSNKLNNAYAANLQDYVTLEQLLSKEASYAPSNASVQPFVEDAMLTGLQNSLSNSLPTKVLESAMVDYTDCSPYPLADTLLNTWIYMASAGLYESVILVTDPKSNETIPLKANEAWVFAWYAYCAASNVQIYEIPIFGTWRVRRDPLPTVDDLMSVVDPKYVDINDARTILARHQRYHKVVSISAFYDFAWDIWSNEMIERKLISYQENFQNRGWTHVMVDRLYCDRECDMRIPQSTYPDWFVAKNINIKNWTRGDFAAAWTQIVGDATGANLNKKITMGQIQAAMIKIMKFLSSYSVQYITSINEDHYITGDTPVIRLGDMHGQMSDIPGEHEVDVRPVGSVTGLGMSQLLDLSDDLSNIKISGAMSMRVQEIEYPAVKLANEPLEWDCRLDLGPIGPIHYRKPTQSDPQIPETMGIDNYFAMSYVEKFEFRDVYGHHIYLAVPQSNAPDIIYEENGIPVKIPKPPAPDGADTPTQPITVVGVRYMGGANTLNDAIDSYPQSGTPILVLGGSVSVGASDADDGIQISAVSRQIQSQATDSGSGIVQSVRSVDVPPGSQ